MHAIIQDIESKGYDEFPAFAFDQSDEVHQILDSLLFDLDYRDSNFDANGGETEFGTMDAPMVDDWLDDVAETLAGNSAASLDESQILAELVGGDHHLDAATMEDFTEFLTEELDKLLDKVWGDQAVLEVETGTVSSI
jgi:hypothetical protein